MWFALAKWLAGFVTGPVFDDLLKGYQAKLAAGNTSESIAAELAAKELAVQSRELELQTQLRIAEIGHPFEPDRLMGYCVAVYFFKLLIWDKVLGLGTTDGLAGFASTTANLIVASYFTKRGFENVARIIKR
ncbi:MAG TPA: hypothetical protein VKT76_17220 [Bradyrhizobium sp.]|nr:hypothetical protein [Bradyrhizobium sp.]